MQSISKSCLSNKDKEEKAETLKLISSAIQDSEIAVQTPVPTADETDRTLECPL